MERIQILTHLQEFRFHIGCTTEVIIELSKYCPRLKKLSVQDSVLLDDKCVEHVLKLTQLRSVNVSNTSVSSNRYRALLSGLRHVQNIIWSLPVDLVLTNLREYLPSVTKLDGTISDARLLVLKCPKLKKLRLRFLTDDISDIRELRNVAFLSIRKCSCTVIRLSVALARLGRTLSALEAHEAENVDVDDIINYCAVLNELKISSCSITCTAICDRKWQHFQNLKKLKLIHNKAPSSFCHVLHFYVNLKVFHVAGMSEINDTLINQLVRLGGFRNVTEFIVDHCGYLSMQTTSLIRNTCPNLTKIGNVGSWSGVGREEEVNFLNFVRDNNLSLTVCH
jgi:hypothetical protein